MSKHFQLLDFLRRTPKDLLKLYAHRRGLLSTFDWGPDQSVPASRVAAALKAEGEQPYQQTLLDFHRVWKLQGREFTLGILNEVHFHGDGSAIQALTSLRSHLGKALWTVLERSDLIRNAKILRDIDKIPGGSWLKYGRLPLRPGAVSSEVEQAMQDALVDFFTKTEFRGANCKVDCLLRGEDESIFYTYSEDHPDVDLSFLGGNLTPQVIVPVFEVIFKHNNAKQTLEIYFEGDRSIAPKLRSLFARVVLSEVIGDDVNDCAPMYEPNRLIEPGFAFRHSADLGISDVRVTKLRYVVRGEPWRRFIAEADAIKNGDALNDFVAQLTSKLPKKRLFVDQACINVLFHGREGDRRAPSRTVWLTHPNSLRLKRDDLGDRIVEMLIQSGIERHEQDEET